MGTPNRTAVRVIRWIDGHRCGNEIGETTSRGILGKLPCRQSRDLLQEHPILENSTACTCQMPKNLVGRLMPAVRFLWIKDRSAMVGNG